MVTVPFLTGYLTPPMVTVPSVTGYLTPFTVMVPVAPPWVGVTG